jgi:hypothetical protein
MILPLQSATLKEITDPATGFCTENLDGCRGHCCNLRDVRKDQGARQYLRPVRRQIEGQAI